MRDEPGLDFSFSGLKTALVYAVRDLSPSELEYRRADLAASFQAAVVEQLTSRLERALDAESWDAVALGGGVAANTPLRHEINAICDRRGLQLKLVPPELCTDNAAMIAAAALATDPTPYPEYLSWDATTG